MSKSLEELFKDVITEPQNEYDWGENEYIARLEKALDKACEMLEASVFDVKHFEEVDLISVRKTLFKSKDEWKEYLLNED